MPDYVTTSFWFSWALFGVALVYLLITLRPFDWGAICQALALAAMLLILGFGLGVLFGEGDLRTMSLLMNGRGEEVCVAGGYACAMYAILVAPPMR